MPAPSAGLRGTGRGGCRRHRSGGFQSSLSGVAFGSEPFDLALLCGKRLLGVPECGYRVVLPAVGRPRRRSRRAPALPSQQKACWPDRSADAGGRRGPAES